MLVFSHAECVLVRYDVDVLIEKLFFYKIGVLFYQNFFALKVDSDFAAVFFKYFFNVPKVF